MKTQGLFAVISVFPFFASAQKSEAPTVLKDGKGIIQAMEFTDSDKGASFSEQDFMKDYLKTTADDGFVKAKDKQRSQEFIDDHFDQFYKGVRVDGAGYNLRKLHLWTVRPIWFIRFTYAAIIRQMMRSVLLTRKRVTFWRLNEYFHLIQQLSKMRK